MKKLTIRHITGLDIDTLFIFRNEELFIQNCTNRKRKISREDFIKEIYNDFTKDRVYQFIIEFELKPIGTIWIYKVDEEFFISTYIISKYTSLGIGIYAHCRVLQFIFENTDIEKVFADVYDFNTLSINTIKKRGYEKTNLKIKSQYFVDDVYIFRYVAYKCLMI